MKGGFTIIQTIALSEDNELLFDVPLTAIQEQNFRWYWVDFEQPTKDEEKLLHSFFQFHALAIEDSLYRLQRPKMDYYEDFTFFVLHSICQENLKPEELTMFIGTNFVVTFHYTKLQELEVARDRIIQNPLKWAQGHLFVAYQIIDKIVDDYFPILYKIEDNLNEIEDTLSPTTVHLSMDSVFDVRTDLLRLRRTITPMRELLYRMLASEKLGFSTNERAYFGDIHDHLVRLAEILESNRELTADIRDSQLSINSNQMNRIMMTLTIISSVFIPLTFIAGLYGMNFVFMPELQWRYSYLAVLVVMLVIGVSMLLWFKKKGWLQLYKS